MYIVFYNVYCVDCINCKLCIQRWHSPLIMAIVHVCQLAGSVQVYSSPTALLQYTLYTQQKIVNVQNTVYNLVTLY